MTVEKKERYTSWLSESGKQISTPDLLKIYDVHENEQRAFLDLHYKNRNYYMTLISALLATFVGGILQFHKEPLSFILFLIPITIIMLLELAKKTIDRYYQRFLESVVIIAKIEYLLGIMGVLKTHNSKSLKILWSKDKQLVPNRWVMGRNEFESSQEFIDKRMSMGDNRNAHLVFNLLEVITIILLLVSLWFLIQFHFN